MKKILISAILSAGLGLYASAYVKVGNLTVEGLSTPLNIEREDPRLSWIIPSHEKNVRQSAYRIL
ncbi:MAG: hypothetical protein K2H87_03260, partial [Duncaniella sp.]|nr:hypothetical protein [Duncaniella sp.]